jgi:hypothetical protein
VRGVVRLSVRQPLAFRASNRLGGPFGILNPKGRTLVVPEIEFRQIPLQVSLRDVVIYAGDPALENAEIILDRVGVGVTANIFLNAVIDGLVSFERAAHDAVLTGIIRHQRRLAMHLRKKDGAQGLGVDAGDVLRTDPTATFDEREHAFLTHPAYGAGALAAVFVLLFAADVSLICFDDLAPAGEVLGGGVRSGSFETLRAAPSAAVRSFAVRQSAFQQTSIKFFLPISFTNLVDPYHRRMTGGRRMGYGGGSGSGRRGNGG